MAMVPPGRSRDQVALAQARLPDDVRRNPGVARIGEVAVSRAANEPAVARWVEPTDRFAVGDDRCRRRLHLILTAATTSATAMTAVASSVAMVLVVTTVVSISVEVLPTAAVMFMAVIRWRRRRSRRSTGLSLATVRWRRRTFSRGGFGSPVTIHRGSFGSRLTARTLDWLDSRRGFCRIAFVCVLVRTRLGALIFRLPSGTRTAAPATGAATFTHVVEKVLVDVCSMRLVRRNSSGANATRMTRTYALTHAQLARDESDTVWNGNERAFARRLRSRRVARSPHAIPATFISVKRWPGVSRRSRRGATHPSLARSAQPQGRRPLYEYRTGLAFAQARRLPPPPGSTQ